MLQAYYPSSDTAKPKPAGDDKRPLHHVSREKETNCYSKDTVRKIQILYIVAAIVWLALIYFGQFANKYDYISYIILSIPVLVYFVNYNQCPGFEVDSEADIFRGNFLSFGYLIFIVFMNWDKVDDKAKFFRILVVSLILIMLSVIDLWMDKRNMHILKHAKSALQTASLTLLAFVLYLYYLDQSKK